MQPGRLLVWIIVLSALAFGGLLSFGSGFLLKRRELDFKSSCNDGLVSNMNASHSGAAKGGCYGLPPSYGRVIVLLIDALRHDFLVQDEENTAFYANNFNLTQKLLRDQPDHAMLFKFIADAPTTTMQRIKGLTTGSLPTFMDMSTNFASPEIDEDNILQQLHTRAAFVGDDTWTSLFPSLLDPSFPYPSFNVRDLDTVDQGVREHMSSFVRTLNNTLLVMHELGVDHCGHRFGPNHPAMRRKLREVDEDIASIIAEMRPDDLLMVMGDHGMTSSGDHGGDSKLEVEAGLFIYSPRKLVIADPRLRVARAEQIDLPPTLALLLGTPIPFASLGRAMWAFFAQDADIALKAARANALQIMRYLEAYENEESSAFG